MRILYDDIIYLQYRLISMTICWIDQILVRDLFPVKVQSDTDVATYRINTSKSWTLMY